MPNVNSHPAAAASASLGIETQRAQQVQQSASPSPVASPQATSLATGEQYQVSEYKVRKGDTLWDIAKVKMGDANKWPELLALNKNQIRNPNLIFPGQVLAIPQQVQVAPTVPSQPVSSPAVDPTPPPAAPVLPAPPPPTPVAEEVIVPSQPAPPPAPEPEPIAPTAPEPVVQQPVAEPVAPQPEPVQAPAEPVQPEAPIYLRPPEEMPYPDDPLAVAPPAEAPAEPTAPAQPTAPVQEEPAAPTPPPFSTIGQPSQAENKGSGIGKAAIIGGVLGTAGTGAALIGITKTLSAPLSNLGGYATAQVVAKSINTVTSKVGLKLPTGPALTQVVSKIGGPKVAGAVTAVAVGAVVAGVAAGGYYLYNRATKDDAPATPTPAQANQTPPLPQGPSAPAQPAAPTANSDAAAALGNLQPVVDENSRPPADVSGKFQELDGLLKEKKYMFFGAATRPDDIRAVGVQIWLDGQVDDRVKLANTLVSNGQSELLGRIMSHEETQPVEIAQVMSQPAFPVRDYMKGLDDNQAFLVLNALSGVAAMGEPQSARVIGETVKAYDGMMDREGPFNQLRQHHQSVGSWNQLPADLRQQIDGLLK